MNELVPFADDRLPALIRAASDRAQSRFWEFFGSNIRNPHTRRALATDIAIKMSDQSFRATSTPPISKTVVRSKNRFHDEAASTRTT